MNDNFHEAVTLINRAYIIACGGYYEPKSTRDMVLASHIKHTLETISSPAFNELVEKTERQLDTHDKLVAFYSS